MEEVFSLWAKTKKELRKLLIMMSVFRGHLLSASYGNNENATVSPNTAKHYDTYLCNDPLLFREFNADRGIIVTDEKEKIVYCNGGFHYASEFDCEIEKALLLLRKGC